MPVTDGSERNVWEYSFELGAWSRFDIVDWDAYSNIVLLSQYNEPELFADINGTIVLTRFHSTIEGTPVTGEIKTKAYNEGAPEKVKVWRNGYLSYISTDFEVIVEVYLDENDLPFKTIRLDIATSMKNVLVPVKSRSKHLELSFQGLSTDFEIEEFRMPQEEITVLDR